MRSDDGFLDVAVHNVVGQIIPLIVSDVNGEG